MGARGDLRHHPAIGTMLVELGAHEIGEDALVAGIGHHRRRRLVAARLDTENNHPKTVVIIGRTIAKRRGE